MKDDVSEQKQPKDTRSWLPSIIELTEHKDYVLLSLAFLEKLNNFSGIHKINIYEVYGFSDNQPTDRLVIKDILELMSAPVLFYERINLYASDLADNPELRSSSASAIQQTVFPIHNSGMVQRLLVIDWFNIDQQDWSQILCLLNVYSNLLNIIDEKDRDRLTGLLNRYTFENNLENIINYSKQQSKKARGCNENSWIAILDIDHFKQVNDNYGHCIGDEILLLFSRFLLSTFRYSDIIFRFGGEEFVVVLTGCDKQGAEIALNRFRTTIENHLFPQVGQITVSAGFVFLDTTQLPNTLLDYADKALYRAKETGRNRVISYEDFSVNLELIDDAKGIELF